MLPGGFRQLEHLAYCDKVAIDHGRKVTDKRKWKTVWNDSTVQAATRLLHSGVLTPGEFLHRTSYAILAAVKHGLRIRNEHQNEEN